MINMQITPYSKDYLSNQLRIYIFDFTEVKPVLSIFVYM